MSLVPRTTRPGSKHSLRVIASAAVYLVVLLPATAPAATRSLPRAPVPHATQEIGPAGHWVAVPRDTFVSPQVSAHAGVVDAANDRFILYTPTSTELSYDLWEMPLTGAPSWKPLASAGTHPTSRLNTAVAYDPVRGRMLVFGGRNGNSSIFFRDVWALDLSGPPTWTELLPTGTLPSNRAYHTMTYDPVRDRMLVFGGVEGGTNARRNDVWALDLSGTPAWTQLAPSGVPPAVRYGHAAVYDPVRDRLLVHGGADGFDPYFDMHALSLSGSPEWNAVPMAIGGPQGRRYHAVFFDSVHDGVVLYGGDPNSGLAFADTWTFSFASGEWTEFGDQGPGQHTQFASAYDAEREQIVIEAAGLPQASTWAYALEPAAWAQLLPPDEPTSPSARGWHAAAFDPLRDRMLMHGGSIGGGAPGADTWAMDLVDVPSWSPLAPTGAAPALSRHALVFDPVRDRMLVFGGIGAAMDSTPVLTFDPEPAWSMLRPTGPAPSAREAPGVVYDPVRDRVLLFGGFVSNFLGGGTGLNDLWELTLGPTPAWTLLTPSGVPPAGRGYHGMVYDAALDRMVVIGGMGTGSSDPTTRRDVWALSLAGTPTWSLVTPLGSTPRFLQSSPVVLDAFRRRALVYASSGFADSVFALSLEPPETWGYLEAADGPPNNRRFTSAVFDPSDDRLVLFGGAITGGWTADAWELRFESPVIGVDPDDGIRGPALVRAVPNPSTGPMHVSFTLRERAPVVLELYDLAGRRLARRELGPLGPGDHAGRFDEATALPTGLYLVRLVRPRETVIARVVHVR
jgi:galactose oxidase-like protein